MINLDQLRIFQAVAQSRSFTRAAALVHLTQPGISKHIKQMEAYFGDRLFDRSGKKVALTESGEVGIEVPGGSATLTFTVTVPCAIPVGVAL